MMKKELSITFFVIIAVFSVFIINSIGTVSAVGPDDVIQNQIGVNPGDFPQNPEDAKQITRDYLKKEWGNILVNNSVLGPVIVKYRVISPYTDPIFKYTLGVAPGLNWLFVLTLTIWILLLTYFYRVLKSFSTFSKGVSFTVSLCLVVIAANLGVQRVVSSKLISLIGLMTTWWMQLIAVIIIWVFIILTSLYSRKFEHWMNKIKENRKKMKEAMRLADLETEKAINKGFRETVTKAFKEE